MRFLFTLLNLIYYTLLFAQVKKTSSDPFINAGKKTEIIGQIKNYVPGNSNRFIRFRTYDVSGYKDTTSFIDKNGRFTATIPQQFECDLALIFDESYIRFYATPGEKINMFIDPDKLKSTEDKSNAILLTGRSAPISQLMMKFKLTGEEFKLPEENWEDSTLSDKVIAEAIVKRMNKEIDSLERWIKKKTVTNKTFVTWARNKIIYDAGSGIASNIYISTRRKANDQQLMEFIKDISIDNKRALNNSSYYSFLQMLAMDMQFIVNSPIYDSVRKQMGKNAVPIYLDKIDKYSKGFAKQMMYYHTLVSNSVEKTTPYTERFDSAIRTSYLKELILAKRNSTPFKPYNIIQRLKDYQIDDSLKARLISIFESNNKNLFLDFWGSWCGPCMREMPHYPKMIDQFKNSELRFLFFGVETSEEKALEIKNKYGIDAIFITLTDNEARILNQVLQFSSYPSHFIIGPDGFVKERLNVGLLSGNELSPVAFDKIKKYSSFWY